MSHVEEWVECDVEILVDKAEMDNAPSQFGIEPSHAIAHHTVAVEAAHRSVAAQTFGIHLAEEKGVEVIDKIRNMSSLKQVPIIMASVLENKNIAEEREVIFLSKPIDVNELFDLIEKTDMLIN